MSRNNHVDEQRENDGSDIAEVTQLCHEYSSEREDFHKLGFQCLLKKLKEIEKIILTISKMSGNEALQFQKDTINAFKDDVIEAAHSSSHQQAAPKDIQLPDDLTSHSKKVLHEIFQQFEATLHDVTGRLKIKFLETLNESYCIMETTVNNYSQAQRAGAKSFIEGLLNSDCTDQNTSRPRNVSLKQVPSADYELNLPEDLSPYTKSVLNEIFSNYETNVATLAENIKKQIHELLIGAFGQFESSVDLMTEKQSAELRHEMESVFEGQSGVHRKGTVTKGGKVKLSKGECGFDAKLARHFQELSRVVQVILDKKDSAIDTSDENGAANDENCQNDVPDQVVQEPGAANQDDLDETEFRDIPNLKMDKKRLARII